MKFVVISSTDGKTWKRFCDFTNDLTIDSDVESHIDYCDQHFYEVVGEDFFKKFGTPYL